MKYDGFSVLCWQVILKDVDALLYVDTDVLFLRPMDDIWSFFKAFNSTQLAAMAPEHEIPKIGWYSRFARHPFYGVTGVNSGVMLMNLTRIRSTLFKVREPCHLKFIKAAVHHFACTYCAVFGLLGQSTNNLSQNQITDCIFKHIYRLKEPV